MSHFTKSDAVLVPPNEIVAKQVEKIRARVRLIINVSADNVFPGQPITVRWRFNLGPSSGINVITARFRVDGHTVFEKSGIPSTSALEGTGDQTTVLSIADLNVARQIYKTGGRRLELEVDAGERHIYRGRAHFYVIREAVDASWWEWRVPAWESVEWKKPYLLNGMFVNKGHAAIATLWAELPEARAEDDPNVDPCVWPTDRQEVRTNLAPASQTPVSWTLVGNWTWLMPATFVPHGPFNKLIAYATAFWFTDEFGNNYPLPPGYICSSRLTRYVQVSALKMDSGATAMGFAIDAALLAAAAAVAVATLIGAGIGAGLLVAAGIAYGLAAGAAEIAKDPPDPDQRFREPVSVTPLALPEWRSDPNGPRMEALRRLFETAARFLVLENARTTTRARMMGARIFGDHEALELQRRGYDRVEQEMRQAAGILDQILPEVQAEVEANDHLDPTRLGMWLERMSRAGLPSEVHQGLLDAGLAPELARDLARLPMDPAITELATANGMVLVPVVAGLKRMMLAVQAEREMIMRGEEACVPTAQSDDSEDEEPRDAPERRPVRRRNCCC